REALMTAGITTLEGLARADEPALSVLSRSTRERLHRQARLQLHERETGAPAYELLPERAGQGLAALPEPDDGDVYLDFEGDPFAEGGGLEYLAGVWTRDGRFHSWWAHDADEEKRLTHDLLVWL